MSCHSDENTVSTQCESAFDLITIPILDIDTDNNFTIVDDVVIEIIGDIPPAIPPKVPPKASSEVPPITQPRMPLGAMQMQHATHDVCSRATAVNGQLNGTTEFIISDDSDVSMKLVPYTDSDSNVSEDYPKKSKSRKKRFQVNKRTWFAEKNKKMRENGQKFLGRNKTENKTWNYGVEKPPRFMKPRCVCKLKDKGNLKCGSISEIDRQNIFDYFWSLTWGEKKTLINNTVSSVPTKRKRNRKQENISRRSQMICYHLRVNDTNVRVCRFMFLNTLCIGRMTVLDWKRTSGPGREIIKKSTTKEKEKPFEKENKELTEFLKALPTMESHYCRISTQKRYLLPEWKSKTCLYRFYATDWCKVKKVSPLSITTFNQALDINNIAFFQPKKDQCEKCAAHKIGHLSEDEFNLHINKKNEARKEKDKDKENERFVFTVDLQAILMAPRSQVSSLYYKTKLCVHNLCFYNLRNKDGFCYIWNETEGGITADEFASICARFITEKILPGINREDNEEPLKIVVYSDGCTYQNRNVTVANALLNVALNEKITIIQKYLEVGHTQMEADSMHSTIERRLKNETINVPAEYFGICREARRNPKKYDVIYLNHTFLKKFNKVEFYKSIRPGKQKGDFKVTDLRAIKYDPDGQIYYKIRFNDEWEILPQKQTRGITSCSTDTLEQIYTRRLKIKKRKFDDLQALKSTLPDDYHSYYDNIPYE